MVGLLLTIHQFPQPHPFSPSLIKLRSKSRFRSSIILSSSSSSTNIDHHEDRDGDRDRRSGFMDIPHLSATHRNLMVELVWEMETRLQSYLLPSSLPPDLQFYHNDSGTSQGSLHIRSGQQDSPVDFILGNWLHCALPSGALDITTLTAYLATNTDAPHFLIEFLQSSPTSFILLLDLPPRKDLILHSDYLERFYNETQLDKQRQQLEKIPEARPYFSSSLFIRAAFSPAAVSIVINCDVGGPARLEEIIRDHVSPVAKEVLGIWLNRCACGGRELGEDEKSDLKNRDILIRKTTVEIDLESSLPKLFGPDVANRVIGAIQKASKT